MNCRESGISYVEVMIAAAILAIAVLPVTSAIQRSLQVTGEDIQATANHYQMLATLESVLAEPFATLSVQALGPTTPSTYSDLVGTPDRRLVFVSQYDGDNADADNDPFTGAEADLIWVNVQIEGTVQSIASLKVDQ